MQGLLAYIVTAIILYHLPMPIEPRKVLKAVASLPLA